MFDSTSESATGKMLSTGSAVAIAAQIKSATMNLNDVMVQVDEKLLVHQSFQVLCVKGDTGDPGPVTECRCRHKRDITTRALVPVNVRTAQNRRVYLAPGAKP